MASCQELYNKWSWSVYATVQIFKHGLMSLFSLGINTVYYDMYSVYDASMVWNINNTWMIHAHIHWVVWIRYFCWLFSQCHTNMAVVGNWVSLHRSASSLAGLARVSSEGVYQTRICSIVSSAHLSNTQWRFRLVIFSGLFLYWREMFCNKGCLIKLLH